ncbi:unnamed protein product [Brachionus calyciflorus]|uniref:Uncharacterized protein n=1 Tax=Brachionus calyciflorus TaxID=104777 RepID=A0A813YPT9_9BILA|nr:unnamed protein product [Brachionus calyciflorus]
MYVQMIQNLRDNSTQKLEKTKPLDQEHKSKMSSTEDLDELSYNSTSSHSTDAFIHENLKHDSVLVNSQLNESLKYKNLVENLELSKLNYENFKNSLNKVEDIDLMSQIEEKLNQINEFKIDLLKAKYQDEINLKVSSIKLVMEKMNLASIKWSNEEYEKKLDKMKQELDLNNRKIGDYEIKIEDLNRRIKSYKNKFEINNEDLELEMRPLEDEAETYTTLNVNNQFDYLQDEINEKNELIESLRAKEDIYLSEINRLKNQLNDYMEFNFTKSNSTTMTNFEFESALIDTTTDSMYREPRIVVTQSKDNRVNELFVELERKDAMIQKLSEDYRKLKEEVETMTHPLFIELQSELQKQFDEEFEDLKICYENKLREELEIYKNINEQKIESIELENKQNLVDIESKHKLELQQLEIDFKKILNQNLQDLKEQLERTQKDNKEVNIKFKYTTEHHSKEISNLPSDVDLVVSNF